MRNIAERGSHQSRNDPATSKAASGASIRPLGQAIASVARRIEQLGLPLSDWPSPRLVTAINLAQVVAWTLLAMAVLPGRGHFTYDQAYFYELSVRVAETLRPPAYGPFVSGTLPAVMTPGGGLYLVYSIPFFFFADPRVGVGWIILLSGAGLWLLDRSFARLASPASLRLALVTTLTWSLWHGRFTDTFWNANLFLFSTPALFYTAVRNVCDQRPRWYWAVLFGVLSGLSLQIHAAGALAILACGLLWATQRPDALTVKSIGLAGLALLATYVPYLTIELRDQWVNSRLLRNAIPPGFDRQGVWRSLGASFLYPSHAQAREALSALFSPGAWYARIFALSLAAATALAAIGVCVRFQSKLIAFSLIPAIPLYLRVTGRPYYDHYVVSVMPLFCLLAAAAAAWLLSRRFLRWLAVGYFVAFAVAGTALLLAGQTVLRPGDPWNGHTVDFQLERTRRALAAGVPVPSGPMDEGVFVEWVVARRLFHRPLMFQVGPYSCDVDLRLSGIDTPAWKRTDKLLIPLAANSVFVCEASRR